MPRARKKTENAGPRPKTRPAELPQLGPLVRAIRDSKGLSAVEVCRQSGGLDPRLLCAIEKNRVRNPSIATLFALSHGLNVSLGDLFTSLEMKRDDAVSVGTQKGAFQMEFPSAGVRLVSFTPRLRPFFYGKISLSARKKMDQTLLAHAYPLFFAVLLGRFDVQVGDRKLSLKEGENIFFNGALPYSLMNALQKESTLLLVTAPSFL